MTSIVLPSRSVLVVGVSGATWGVVEPLITAGRMPHLARLRAEGTSATLASVRARGDDHFRPQVAWASVATGLLPERHGILRYYHEADDLRARPIWELCGERGLCVGIYGWPATWPPRPVRGFVIPSHLARDSRTWPPELAPIKQLDRMQQDREREPSRVSRGRLALKLAQVAFRHKVRLRTVTEIARLSNRMRTAEAEERRLLLRIAKLELSADIFVDLCRRFSPDLMSFHTFLADFAMHRYWRYREPELFGERDLPSGAFLAEAVDEAHARIDVVLGRLVAAAPPGSVVMVLSEHGMAAEPDSPEHGHVYWSVNGSVVLDLVGLPSSAVPCPVARWVAYRPGPGQRLHPQLAARLRDVRVLETGRRLFHVDEHGDEVVVKLDLGAGDPRYRDGALENLHVGCGDAVAPFTAIMRPLGVRRSAMHAEDGILVVAGTGIRRGLELARASVLDVAPTLLCAAGLPVPPGLDGRPLDLFTEQPPALS